MVTKGILLIRERQFSNVWLTAEVSKSLQPCVCVCVCVRWRSKASALILFWLKFRWQGADGGEMTGPHIAIN